MNRIGLLPSRSLVFRTAALLILVMVAWSLIACAASPTANPRVPTPTDARIAAAATEAAVATLQANAAVTITAARGTMQAAEALLTARPTVTLVPTGTPLTASLSGRIVDRKSGTAVAGATVRAGYNAVTTNADGRYTLTGLPAGQFVLSVTRDGYDPGLSPIFTLVAGQPATADLSLFPQGTTPYPKDPMLTNPLDPNGAPTATDAERLARQQGLIGTVINVAETHLKGVYLVNYQRDGEVRAAVATLDHAAWALTDAAGRQWWIVKVCGNLASPLPGQMVVAAPTPQTVPLTALAGADALAVRECPAENCRVLANIPKGQTLELKGCLSDRSWCQVVLADGRVGWCQGGTLRFVAALAAVPVVKAPEARLASSGKIAFFSDRDSPGYAEIYLMNPNGSELTRLTSDLRIPPVMRGGPPSINRFVWSQARRKFLFQNPSGAKLYSVNGDGTGSAIIATGVGYSDPSPDGQLIAYTAYKDQRSEIGLMDFNGSNQRLLTNQATRQYLNLKADSALNGPAWSSDGKRLAFYTAENAICTITLANSTEARLTSAAVSIAGGQLRWSPDDRFITFAAIVGRNYNLFKLEVASGKIMQLVEDGWSSGWSPDGTGIVLERSDEQIWIVNANGSGLTQLTYQGRNCCPVWVP